MVPKTEIEVLLDGAKLNFFWCLVAHAVGAAFGAGSQPIFGKKQKRPTPLGPTVFV
jgi:hypothetical protein